MDARPGRGTAAPILGIDGERDKSRQLAAAAKFARDHPGQFAAAVANLDTLKKDPIRWAAALAPELVASLATGGTSAVASRTAGSLSKLEKGARASRAAAARAEEGAAAAAASAARVKRAKAARQRMLDERGTPYSADRGWRANCGSEGAKATLASAGDPGARPAS